MLTCRFATAYIGKLLVANPQYSKEFGAFNTGKLDYFMMGTDDGTLVKEAAYTALNDITSIAVFRKSTPRLEDYIESSEGPDYWAKAMYDKLSSPFSIMQMRFQVSICTPLILRCSCVQQQFRSVLNQHCVEKFGAYASTATAGCWHRASRLHIWDLEVIKSPTDMHLVLLDNSWFSGP